MSDKNKHQSMIEALTRRIPSTRDAAADNQMKEALKEDRQGAHANPSVAESDMIRAMTNEFKLDDSQESDNRMKDAFTESRCVAKKDTSYSDDI